MKNLSEWKRIPRSLYALHLACAIDLKLLSREDDFDYQYEVHDVGAGVHLMKVSQERYDECGSYGLEDRYYITVFNK